MMKQRGVIAWGNVRSWRGLLYRGDASPPVLGPALWKAYKEGALTRHLLRKHPGGYISFPDRCICHDPEEAERSGSCAPDSPYYMQGLATGVLDERTADPMFHRWVYILGENRLDILHGHFTGRRFYKTGESGRRYLVAEYVWGTVAWFRLKTGEPAWDKIVIPKEWTHDCW